MKLVSPTQKNTKSDPPERINFSNEIEVMKPLTGDETFRLSDFTSDIISFVFNPPLGNVSLDLFCDRNLRKYTFIVDNEGPDFIFLNFLNGHGEKIAVVSNIEPIVKTGFCVIDLYQTATGLIHLVVHELYSI